MPPESAFCGGSSQSDAKATDRGADGACRRGRRPPGLGQASGRRRVARRTAELAGQPPDRGAGASKTQDCRTARRPRGARAASRARCAGRALDMFFVRPNATGHDLPSPSCVVTGGWQEQAMARHVLLELELDQEGVARGTRRDRTARAPRSRSHCSCRPHLLRAGPPRPDAPVPTYPPPRGRARSTGRRGAAAVCPRLAQALRPELAAPRGVS